MTREVSDTGRCAKTTCRSKKVRKERMSPTPLLSKRPKIRCPAVPICPKAVCGRLFCDDSVGDNDTPVLPNGGRPAEILPGVRVPWSGEASRRLFLRLGVWGSSVEYRCVKRDLCRVSMSEAPGIGAIQVNMSVLC